MRYYRLFSFVLVVLFLGVFARAQTTVPTATGSISTQTLSLGGAGASLDLRNVFTVPGVNGQLVQFDTVFGKFNVEMRADAAPQNVANFLNYVQSGAYANSVFHRAVAFDAGGKSIVQGGGYRAPITNGTIPQIPHNAPAPLEYNLPNERGTIAAARTSDINSATSEFYFNTRDNSTALDQSNGGGYTVFGRVIGTGMTVVDSIAALQTWNAGAPFDNIPLRNFNGSSQIVDANLVTMNSVTTIPLYSTGTGAAAITFSADSSDSTVAKASVIGSLLTVTPLSLGSATITATATDTNGNKATTSFAVTVVGGPQFTTQPISQSVNVGGTIILTASTGGSATYQWQRNGIPLTNATGSSLTLSNVQVANAGAYTVVATDATGSSTSQAAIIGIQSTAKVLGDGSVVGTHIQHPNGNFYDQVLLTGPAVTVTADPNSVTRISYIDINDDIIQVEFAGAGTLTLTLEGTPSGPAAPVKYNQPTVAYMKGHGFITIAGANETTNVSVFAVGRATAFDPTGGYNILQVPSATNDPQKNGSSLFVGHPDPTEGMANIGAIAITSTNGKFGGVRTSDAEYIHVLGLTGIYAPGVQFTGPVFVGDIFASELAVPTLILGSASDVRVTGGDLSQDNGRAVQVDGMTRLQMTAGSDSNGVAQPAQPLRARLVRNGVDVTDQLVPPGS